jgi:hypothetical protein
MVPLKALHEARMASRRLKTEAAMLRAEKAGWLAERAQLLALLENNRSVSCNACAIVRASRGE